MPEDEKIFLNKREVCLMSEENRDNEEEIKEEEEDKEEFTHTVAS